MRTEFLRLVILWVRSQSGICSIHQVSSQETDSQIYWHTDIEFPAFKIVRNKLLPLISHPSINFTKAAKMNR